MLRRFNDMPISLKVASAFGLIIVFLVFCAGIAIFALDSFQSSFVSYSDRTAEVEQTRNIDYAVLNLLKQVDAFIVDDTAPALDKATAALDAVNEAIIEGRASLKSQSEAQAIEKIAGSFETYRATWQKLSKLRVLKTKLITESVDPLGQKLKNDVQFFSSHVESIGKAEIGPIASKAADQYNAGRLAVYQLLSSDSEADLKAADAGFAGFEMRLNLIIKIVGEGQEAARLAKVLRSVEAYKDAYHQAADASRELDALKSGEMAQTSTEIVAAVAEVRSAVQASAAAISAETFALANRIRTVLMVVASISFLLAVVMSVVIGRSIARPVVAVATAMKRVAGGDLQTKVIGVGRRDEVGAIADALEHFKVSLAEAEAERQARDADSQARAENRRRELNDLADTFENAVGGIANMLASSSEQLSGSAAQMSRSSSEVSEMATVVATASEEASNSVGTVAAAAEELASSIAEIGRQVNESTEVAAKAVADASGTAGKVRELSEAVRKIGDVVELINNIASQTNLLALNATIEAARAGEAGKGFAVVAAEVKQLADQTARATGEIGSQIATIQASTSESSEAILQVTSTIEHINEVSNLVASSVRDQGVATQEIASSVQKAASGTEQVTSHIVQVNVNAQNSSEAAAEVLRASQALAGQAKSLQEELGRFLDSIRAA